MRVAFTSTDGKNIDEHFGRCACFFVWQIDARSASFEKVVSAVTTAQDEEDRTSARVSAVADCAIVYTVAVGGPAAAKLVSHRIHPMKTGAPIGIAEVVRRLQEVLRGTPPPWLRKALMEAEPSEAT